MRQLTTPSATHAITLDLSIPRDQEIYLNQFREGKGEQAEEQQEEPEEGEEAEGEKVVVEKSGKIKIRVKQDK